MLPKRRRRFDENSLLFAESQHQTIRTMAVIHCRYEIYVAHGESTNRRSRRRFTAVEVVMFPVAKKFNCPNNNSNNNNNKMGRWKDRTGKTKSTSHVSSSRGSALSCVLGSFIVLQYNVKLLDR
jgi:hypothetical protein